jgi:uncharacterized membrane protein YsdA (DUF1294 family)
MPLKPSTACSLGILCLCPCGIVAAAYVSLLGMSRTKRTSILLNLLGIGGLSALLVLALRWPVPAVFLGCLNIWLFGLMWKDKTTSVKHPNNGKLRTPESTLLTLAALGGSPALIASMFILRHKNAKQQFYASLIVIVVLQLITLYGYGGKLF